MLRVYLVPISCTTDFRRKRYIFNLEGHLLLYIPTYITSLAFNDEAFGVPDLISPDQVFQLRAKKDNNRMIISWKANMLDIFIFGRLITTAAGEETSPSEPPPYGQYHSWVLRLGEALEGGVAASTTQSEQERERSLKCRAFQCLFCLMASDLPSADWEACLASKDSLRRHVNRRHLSYYRPDGEIPYPDHVACGGTILEAKMYFKNHAAGVHGFAL